MTPSITASTLSGWRSGPTASDDCGDRDRNCSKVGDSRTICSALDEILVDITGGRSVLARSSTGRCWTLLKRIIVLETTYDNF